MDVLVEIKMHFLASFGSVRRKFLSQISFQDALYFPSGTQQVLSMEYLTLSLER